MTTEAGTKENKTETTPVQAPVADSQGEKKLTSRFRGVCWNRKNKRWQAAINRAGRYIYLGSFISETEAAKAFDQAAVKLRGHAAKINFAFADYPAEMVWHNQTSYMGDTTDLVLKHPKLLREKVHLDPSNANVPTVVDFAPGQFQRNPACTYAPASLSRMPCPVPLSIIHGEVVGRTTQTSHGQPNGAPVYLSPSVQETSFEKRPMPSSVFVNGENGMLSPHMAPYTPVPYHLSDPSVRPDPVRSEPPTSADTFLPVVNMPDGAEVTQLYRGARNAFAMGFVRQETTDTEVLLYDGQAMHEVGCFSTKDDAAQSCQALLKLLNRVKSGDESQSVPNDSAFAPAPSRSAVSAPEALYRQLVEDREVPYVDKLEGTSPFEVPPGARPSFLDNPDDGSHDVCVDTETKDDTVSRFDHEDLPQESVEGKGESIEQRMGSLLQLDSTISVGPTEEPPAPQPPTHIGEYRNEASMKITSSLSLINSGSLKNLLLVLNQSGNFSVFKKDGSEADETETEPQLGLDLTFTPCEGPTGVETPTLRSRDRADNPLAREPSGTEDGLAFLNQQGHSPFKRSHLEVEPPEYNCKKQKTCA